jgi:hypothetical protein
VYAKALLNGRQSAGLIAIVVAIKVVSAIVTLFRPNLNAMTVAILSRNTRILRYRLQNLAAQEGFGCRKTLYYSAHSWLIREKFATLLAGVSMMIFLIKMSLMSPLAIH